MRFPSGDPVRNAAAVGPFLPPVAGQSSPIGLGYSGPMRFPSGDPVRSPGVVGPFLPPLSGQSSPIGGDDIPGSPWRAPSLACTHLLVLLAPYFQLAVL